MINIRTDSSALAEEFVHDAYQKVDGIISEDDVQRFAVSNPFQDELHQRLLVSAHVGENYNLIAKHRASVSYNEPITGHSDQNVWPFIFLAVLEHCITFFQKVI